MNAMPRNRPDTDLLIRFTGLLLFFLFAYSWAAFFKDIYGLEARNALMAREMVEDGFSLIPRALGRPYPDYPPFYFWLETLFSLPFGRVNAFSAALPSALSAVGLIALTFCLGREISPRRGWFAALIVATVPDFWLKAGVATIDMLLAFWISAAILCLFFGDGKADSRVKRRYTVGAAIFLLLAFFTKGPIGIVLPAAAWGGYLLWDRRLKDFLRFTRFMTCAGMVCVGLELVAVWKTGGLELIRDVIRMQVTGRLGEESNHPFYYYLICLMGIGGVWLLFSGPVWMRGWSEARENSWKTAARNILPDHPADRLALIWFLAVLSIFTLASTRHGRYLLPLFPAFTVLLASGVEKTVDLASADYFKPWRMILTGLIAIVFIGTPAALFLFPETRFVPILAIFFWLGAVSVGWVFLQKRPDKPLRTVGLLVFFLAAGFSAADLAALPAASRKASGKSFVETVESRVSPSLPVLLWGVGSDGDGIKYALHTNQKPSALHFEDTFDAPPNLSPPYLLICRLKHENRIQDMLSPLSLTPVAQGAIRSHTFGAYRVHSDG